MLRHLVSLVCIFAVSIRLAAEIPVEDLSHEDAFKAFTLSRDGKAVAYSETIKGKNVMKILNLDTGERVGVDLLSPRFRWSQGSHFFWVNDDRLVFSSVNGYESIRRDGRDGKIVAARRILHVYPNTKEGFVLGEVLDVNVNEATSTSQYIVDATRPNVAKYNTYVGTSILYEQNTGNITNWLINADGEITGALQIKGTKYRVVHRDSPKNAWQALPGMDWEDPQVLPLGYDGNNQTLYVSRLNTNNRWAIYPYNLQTHQFGDVILEDDKYDIISQTDSPAFARVVYSPDKKRLLGIRYYTAYPRQYWIDQDLAKIQAGLDDALKGKVNVISSMSDDLQKLVVFSWSDRDPGTYYLFDREKQSLSLLSKTSPWIKEEEMSPKRPIKIQARDGQAVYGYLTLPIGKKPVSLPMVVITKDYWSRVTWGFDRTTQFFASRGYAVLEVNARGSTGYGEDFKRAGFGKIELMLGDIADAVKWAVSQGFADSSSVALVSESGMSGTQNLISLALYPNLYACGVADSPYTDWTEVINRDRLYSDGLNYMHERLGDPNNPNDILSKLSPLQLADRIKAPVLLTHTERYKPDHYSDTKKMVKLFQESGSIVEFKTDYDKTYGYQNYGKWLEDAEAFLKQHMPAK